MSKARSSGGPTSALEMVGACRWQGRRQPLEGRLQNPVPKVLRRLARDKASWLAGVFPADLGRLVRGAARGRAPVEYRLVTERAGVVWVRHWFTGSGQGKAEGVVQIIDEQKALEAECIRISEYERTNLGQELHDDVGQLLAGLAAMLGSLAGKITAADPQTKGTIEELMALLSAGMVRTRSLAHGLVLLRTAQSGSELAFAELAKNSALRFNIQVTTRYGRTMPQHDSEQLVQLYRIAQEAIGNAVKHGRASRIEVRFVTRGDQVRLTITDNGCGIPARGARTEGLGLRIMAYRAAVLGGVLGVAAGRRRGTMVTLNYTQKKSKAAGRRTRS